MRPTRRQLLKIYGVALPAAIYSLTATRRRMRTNREERSAQEEVSKKCVAGIRGAGASTVCVRVCVCRKHVKLWHIKFMRALQMLCDFQAKKDCTRTRLINFYCVVKMAATPPHTPCPIPLCYKACVAAFWAHSAMKCQMAEERCRRQVMKQSAFAK